MVAKAKSFVVRGGRLRLASGKPIQGGGQQARTTQSVLIQGKATGSPARVVIIERADRVCAASSRFTGSTSDSTSTQE